MPLLSVQNLCAYYQTEVYGISRTVRAVDGVSFELYPNEIYGVAGESSCGKTTLIKVISGSIKPPLKAHSGSVNYQFDSGEIDMLKISQADLRENIRWKEISYVMQGSMSVLNPVRKVIKTFEDIVDSHQPITNKKLLPRRDPGAHQPAGPDQRRAERVPAPAFGWHAAAGGDCPGHRVPPQPDHRR